MKFPTTHRVTMASRKSKPPRSRPDSSTLILVNDENKANLSALAAELASGTPPSAFVGAGVSAQLGYPTWRQLIDNLFAKILVWEADAREAKRPIPMQVDDIKHSPNDLYWTAKACLDLFEFYENKPEYYSQLATAFSGGKGKNSVLDTLVSLPFPHFLTTNYDPSIQEAHLRVFDKPLKVVDWGLGCNAMSLPSARARARSCVHLHGNHTSPEKVILNEDDYQARYIQDTAHIGSLIRYLNDNNVVFVGFSLDDQDFMNLLRTIKASAREVRGRHYAILPLSDSKQEGHIKSETERLDDKYNIKAIFYRQLTNNFLGLEEAIKLLAVNYRQQQRKRVAHSKVAKPKKAAFKFDARALKRPKFADDPNKFAFGREAERNERRLSAIVSRTKDGSRWFRIELTVDAMPGSPDFPDKGVIYVHPTFRKITYEGNLAKSRRQIARTFWAYGAFTVGALVDKGKTALELDLASLKNAPKDFRER